MLYILAHLEGLDEYQTYLKAAKHEWYKKPMSEKYLEIDYIHKQYNLYYHDIPHWIKQNVLEKKFIIKDDKICGIAKD